MIEEVLAEMGWTEEAYRQNPICKAYVRFLDARGATVMETTIDHTPYHGAQWMVARSMLEATEAGFARGMVNALREALLAQHTNGTSDGSGLPPH